MHVYQNESKGYIKFGTFNSHPGQHFYQIETLNQSNWHLNATDFKIGEDLIINDNDSKFRRALIDPSTPYLFMP